MRVDRQLKRELMEMVDNAFADDPLAGRKGVASTVLSEMESYRPDLFDRAQDISLEHFVEALVGEYVRRSRSRLRSDIIAGQVTPESKLPAYEVIKAVKLTIPVGKNYETKPALMCTRDEIQSARMYYAEQKRALSQREHYCAALDDAMSEAELLPGQTVRDLYRAA